MTADYLRNISEQRKKEHAQLLVITRAGRSGLVDREARSCSCFIPTGPETRNGV
jgi:hypothetical protein